MYYNRLYQVAVLL